MPISSIWQGIFSSFDESKADFSAFDSDTWLDKEKNLVSSLLNQTREMNSFSKEYPLSSFVPGLLSVKKQLSILDFGGGMGAQYLDLLAKIPDAESLIDYYIVEGESTITNLPKEMSQFPSLQYSIELPDLSGKKIDIVNMGSCLQYIEDWQGLLKSLNEKYAPDYYVLSDVFAGDIPNFVSVQKFYEYNIPQHFLNFKDFVAFFENELQMEMTYKSKFIRTYFGTTEEFPNQLPEGYRIERPLNLIFKKNEKMQG